MQQLATICSPCFAESTCVPHFIFGNARTLIFRPSSVGPPSMGRGGGTPGGYHVNGALPVNK
ncbi:unnamed protein product [Periconia digitata]|uniref:Uncharacterized protein n=1 Tax=Periconia digitata TaxID=1303443 RepID=A0A9W4XV34_9PLEO|nr:unnamed protein product [Periconia digitata]